MVSNNAFEGDLVAYHYDPHHATDMLRLPLV
jgi:hypothetical protein